MPLSTQRLHEIADQLGLEPLPGDQDFVNSQITYDGVKTQVFTTWWEDKNFCCLTMDGQVWKFCGAYQTDMMMCEEKEEKA